MRKFQQEDSNYYSNNKLNIAFIAEDSKDFKDLQSISLSGSISQHESISSISKIASGNNSNVCQPGSPFYSFQQELSNMDEWSKQTPNIFGKKEPSFSEFRKRTTRNSIQPIIEIPQDGQWVGKLSKCNKKRICEKTDSKNKVVTVQNPQNLQPTSTSSSYDLRSKASKCTVVSHSLNNQNDSSSDEIRQMVQQIGGKKRNTRKMLPQ